MPTHPYEPTHRQRLVEFLAAMSAFVARPVRPLEWHNSPEAWAAVQKEWEMLRKIGTWDEATVREWRDVAREARRTGEKMHVGRIFTLCFEKNYELEAGNPARTFKGRVVFPRQRRPR
ncbi:MAG: hypothetical protein GY772_21455 [bacterium]|nr:hypothetical protein [bacterium]